MTLLRRAPREVYRVYDAEEFLADAGVGEIAEAAPQAPPPRGESARWRHQIAGAMLFVSAMSALGALLAVIGLSSTGSGRRARSGARTTAGSADTAQASRVRPRLEGSPPGAPLRRARMRRAHRHEPTRGTRRLDGDLQTRASVTAAQSRPRLQSVPARAVEVAHLLARASSGQARPRPAEFGFER